MLLRIISDYSCLNWITGKQFPTNHAFNFLLQGLCTGNASYAVSSACRGQHIGEKLVLDCLKTAKELGFRVLQFNAVVESNIHARHLYERLGFIQLGTILGGFRMKDGRYENICPYYHVL